MSLTLSLSLSTSLSNFQINLKSKLTKFDTLHTWQPTSLSCVYVKHTNKRRLENLAGNTKNIWNSIVEDSKKATKCAMELERKSPGRKHRNDALEAEKS